MKNTEYTENKYGDFIVLGGYSQSCLWVLRRSLVVLSCNYIHDLQKFAQKYRSLSDCQIIYFSH
jgi:hypothetical protein